ncbi:hypothetical protein [Arenimonas composti]|nr:hypothetical protein [Arenimonas composti]
MIARAGLATLRDRHARNRCTMLIHHPLVFFAGLLGGGFTMVMAFLR